MMLKETRGKSARKDGAPLSRFSSTVDEREMEFFMRQPAVLYTSHSRVDARYGQILIRSWNIVAHIHLPPERPSEINEDGGGDGHGGNTVDHLADVFSAPPSPASRDLNCEARARVSATRR